MISDTSNSKTESDFSMLTTKTDNTKNNKEKEKKMEKINQIKEFTGHQTLVSNFYTFNFDRTQNVFLYSIKTKHKIQDNLQTHYGLIKRMQNESYIRFYLRKFFKDYYITGNSLFGEARNDLDKSVDTNTIAFRVSWIKNKIRLIHDGEEEPDTPDIYEVIIEKKFQLADYKKDTTTRDQKEHVKRYINIILQKSLEKLKYIRSEPGVKAVYYKQGLMDQECLNLSDNVFFVYGYKVNTNFYDNNEILIKTVQKFRMVRTDTYLDYYLYLKDGKQFKSSEDLDNYFEKFMRNRIGLARHTEKRVKVTGLRFDVDITKFEFELKERRVRKPYVKREKKPEDKENTEKKESDPV